MVAENPFLPDPKYPDDPCRPLIVQNDAETGGDTYDVDCSYPHGVGISVEEKRRAFAVEFGGPWIDADFALEVNQERLDAIVVWLETGKWPSPKPKRKLSVVRADGEKS